MQVGHLSAITRSILAARIPGVAREKFHSERRPDLLGRLPLRLEEFFELSPLLEASVELHDAPTTSPAHRAELIDRGLQSDAHRLGESNVVASGHEPACFFRFQ